MARHLANDVTNTKTDRKFNKNLTPLFCWLVSEVNNYEKDLFAGALICNELEVSRKQQPQFPSLLTGSEWRIYSREEFMDRSYSDQRIVRDRTIDSHIKKLRKKIHAGDPGLEISRSVYGVGYKYAAP